MNEFTLRVAEKLNQLAKTESTIPYSWLDDEFHIPCSMRGKHKNIVHKALHEIMQDDIDNKRPLLTSVVTNKAKERKTPSPATPSDEYFNILCQYRSIAKPTTPSEKVAIHQDELMRVYSHYREI